MSSSGDDGERMICECDNGHMGDDMSERGRERAYLHHLPCNALDIHHV